MAPDARAGAREAAAARARGRRRDPVLPHVNFALTDAERRFLSPAWSDGRAKNISLDGDRLRGAAGTAADRAELAAMIARFAACAGELVAALFPRYAPYVQARADQLPAAAGRGPRRFVAQGRLAAAHRRVPVAAEPRRADPARVLEHQPAARTASGASASPSRRWRRRCCRASGGPLPGAAAFLAALHVTKGLRSRLRSPDARPARSREGGPRATRSDCAQEIVRFAPGTTWLCFSDQVMHAAVSGQFMLEQTIHLPVSSLYDPARSPLAILQRLTGRALAPAD